LHTQIGKTEGGGWLCKSREAQLAKLRGVGGYTRAGRLDFANSSTCALKLAELRVVDAQASMGRVGKLSFANLSTCVLKSAKLVEQGQRDSILPI